MCGLVGMINLKKKKFNYTAFCTLGIDNDSRGGDSVGLFIDKKYEYYFEGARKSYFFDFMNKSELLKNTTECEVALAHCRWASVGGATLKGAQPVIIKDENDDVKYVLMHNGTIHNAEKLAQEYIPDIDVHDMTDSQIMAHIFYYKGYDALAKYNGTAAFIIVDYRTEKPTYMMWRGESKKSSYQKEVVEERPLTFVTDEEGNMYISSIDRFFQALLPNRDIFIFPANKLCKYDGELWNLGYYDRSEQQQDKEWTAVTTVHYNTSSSGKGGNSGSSFYNSNNNNDYQLVTGDSRDGKCYIGNCKCQGPYHITDYGRVTTIENGNEMWFWNGTLLKNSQAYMYLTKFQKELDATIQEIDEWYNELVLYLSPYPYYKLGNSATACLKEIKSPIGGFDYTGNMYWPFIRQEFTYNNGIFQKSTNCTIFESLTPWRLHKSDELDLDVLAKF